MSPICKNKGGEIFFYSTFSVMVKTNLESFSIKHIDDRIGILANYSLK